LRLIGLAVTLAVGLTLVPLAAGAQQAGKIHRVGVLAPGTAAAAPLVTVFRHSNW